MLKSIYELPNHYEEIAVSLKARVSQDFEKYGLELVDFLHQPDHSPDEVQRMIDEKSGMQAVGNLESFLKFKAAKALGDAAKAEEEQEAPQLRAWDWAWGRGRGTPSRNADEGDERRRDGGPGVSSTPCPKCHSPMPFYARFCPSCGTQIVKVNKCLHCGKDLPLEANFCMVCGTKVEKPTSAAGNAAPSAAGRDVLQSMRGEADGLVKSPSAALRFNFVVAAHRNVRLTPQFLRA